MSEALEQKVGFPVAEPGSASIAMLAVERLHQDRGDRFAIAPGLGDVQNILMEARSGDPPEHRLDVVWVRVDQADFDGKSYGLALALADQRVRANRSDFPALIATGVIARAGRGRIAPVEAFEAKAAAVVAHARAARGYSDFAFSGENWRRADTATREALEYAEAEGVVRLHPAETLSDLRALWGDAPAKVPIARRYGVTALGGSLFVLILLAGALSIRGDRVRNFIAEGATCERALGALSVKTRPEEAGEAVRACEQSVRENPGNARQHLLLGQAYALNGGDALAGREWKASAERGDADGMAAYGRWLWLSDPADATRVKRALDWLKRGANAGSIAAAEDIGYLLIDGNALPADQAQAEQWFKTARAMRAMRDRP